MDLPLAEPPAGLRNLSLQDKYRCSGEPVYLSGTQAFVRLLMLQKERDLLAGLNTAGFVSGYRGSPLGGVDRALWQAGAELQRHGIRFQPGLNEDLAATAVWGTQQVGLQPGAKVDGVFSLWYGKGPGVDRSLDALKHANAAGTAAYGGVIALAGDDHAAKSSSLPHQSDHVFAAAGMPVVFPASVQEILDLGLHAWAMSRYAGVWVAMKCISDVVESASSVIADARRVEPRLPTDFPLPEGGLSIRWPDSPLQQEARLLNHKLYAVLAYIRANGLNHDVTHPRHPRFGIIASGKAWLDTLQALADLGLGLRDCEEIGIRLHKVSVIWPLDATTSRGFATGLQEILVVEEKRQLIEYALKEELYGWRDDVRPRVIGKFDSRDGGEHAVPQGEWMLPIRGELSPAQIANAVASRVLRMELPEGLRERVSQRLAQINRLCARSADPLEARLAYYCSGCPHNTSTQVPEGSRALGGIGCHYMALWMPERRTATFTQMGGEGVPWIGQAPFTAEKHVFANLGDGTYFHSGTLAIRAAVAAGVNITYKILYNDAVAMTGGQPLDGVLTVPQIVRQLQAERVAKIVVVSDDIDKYAQAEEPIPAGTEVHHRDHLEAVQQRLRELPGCTVIVYDQVCAAEKRRRRKQIVDGRPLMEDPPRRLWINEAVCEGCGDCSAQSSCLSIEPVETALGRKRQINQSTCNKDYSCAKGFCPSFVTVKGGRLRRQAGASQGELQPPAVPPPRLPALEAPYGILVTGIGGSGVVTIGQLLGMAAHLEGKAVTTLDITGVSQKGGAVLSHVRLAPAGAAMTAARIGTGSADAVIGCDLVVTAGEEALSKMSPGRTHAVVNSHVAPTARFLHDRDWRYPAEAAQAKLREACGEDRSDFVEAGRLAAALAGDSLAVNPFMLGYAWQRGLLPLSREALRRAIELNGVAVAQNQQAFEWGRYAAHDAAGLRRLLAPAQVVSLPPREPPLAQRVVQCSALLADYGNGAYAARYRHLVERVEQAEAGLSAQRRLSEAVARNYARLLAYKDEYEVARLYSSPAFREQLARVFEGDYRIEYNLAPPLLARRNDRGEPLKRSFGAWMGVVLRLLAKLRFLRGTPFDVFGYTQDRRDERELIRRYERTMEEILPALSPANLATAVEIAALPEQIRGFGHVKRASLRAVEPQWERLMARFRSAAPAKLSAR
ncbi:indolepyruvate ferredoxin oxidoreductase family protein [Solimonas fluminis]|uniref:Indolepyruvate ferredoxin oxidoreductase family protein n=1 Tax=Solimonas fluminis TaxID=2086571 RepID=A0A2S5THI1_9GAMM|nr:indolepyruvate ferredoxin oxidoreductase family protein [Solimonas fluminis]PPE74439.1 indolepyruvate ferredoxin oxidoreductase family protein [Solimonas fluminis]